MPATIAQRTGHFTADALVAPVPRRSWLTPATRLGAADHDVLAAHRPRTQDPGLIWPLWAVRLNPVPQVREHLAAALSANLLLVNAAWSCPRPSRRSATSSTSPS
ncbi:hypothetical protein ACQEU8_00945 [Streptomyces sp. CA-250714]|uniref:hypothetical protein n=1 Tax=Streptomyces sp. CA-250714 TaxID=3240060 RepID=UPI003D94612F